MLIRRRDSPVEVDNLWALIRRLIATASGSGVSVKPLSRAWYVDAGTTTPLASQTGSAGAPFSSISGALTALGPAASEPDATTLFSLLVVPGTYTENPTIPPGRTLEIVAVAGESSSGVAGVTIDGTVTWDNAPSGLTHITSLVLKDVQVEGGITLSDSGGSSPEGFFFFMSTTGQYDGLYMNKGFTGTLDASGATNLNSVALSGISVGTVNAPNSGVFPVGSLINDPVSGASVVVTSCDVEDNITASGSPVQYVGCVFAEDLNVTSPSLFDGPSWQSFVAQGNTWNAGTVTVQGGFLAGQVPSPTPIAATGSVSEGSGNLFYVGGAPGDPGSHLGGPITITIDESSALPGDTMCFSSNDTSGNTVTFADEDTGPIGSLTGPGFFVGRYSGTSWQYLLGGTATLP